MGVAFALKKSLHEVGEFSLAELALWDAWLEKHDPEQRYDRRFGRLCAVVANCHSLEGGWKAEDFMLNPPPAEEELMSEDQFIRDIQAYAASRGGAPKGRK